ncbi:MAG: hypothetical protein R3C49_03840 [Planctomycetaceae bacterium]
MNGLVRCIIAALVGGAFAAAVWAGITYATEMEIGWIAWGVGLVVGIAVRVAAGDNEGLVPGSIAVIGAILALLVGKYAAVHLLVSHTIQENPMTVSAADLQTGLQVGLADEVVAEWEEAGKKMQWPDGMTVEEAESQADYPPDVWAEAMKRWNDIPAEEQQKKLKEREEQIAQFTDMIHSQITQEGFKASFSPIDLLFFGLAIFTAFKVGSGMTSDE